ncbi:sensor histidine kinase [Marinobacterium aestuariivivens]|uniref:histidine kinase n=1 Tax=Marinobacterium aestuariivivens TaxID=1698799 RepID=A0ABW2A9M9_9GAMM
MGTLSILLALGITLAAMRTTRRLEGHFQELYQREALTEMAAQLVHSLRNPLAALRANVKGLLVSPAETREIVDELDRDILSLNDKLSAFLQLTRHRDEAFEPVDIGELVRDAVRLATPALAEQGLSVEVSIPPDMPRPVLQKAAMCDALLNVLINAAQSGQAQGAVQVSVLCQDSVFVTIRVEDRGRGIREQDLPRLFDAFYTTRADGNGLGLAIVQRVLAAHKGWVRAENRPQGGASILLTLPLQQKEPPHWWNKLKKTFPT